VTLAHFLIHEKAIPTGVSGALSPTLRADTTTNKRVTPRPPVMHQPMRDGLPMPLQPSTAQIRSLNSV
jgi:hypothetical protein